MADQILVLGGTRSGKSAFAVRSALERGGDDVTFIATARSGDPEMDARIEAHRRGRPAAWRTVEVDEDLATAVALARPTDLLLIDSLTLWAAAVLEAGGSLEERWSAAEEAIGRRSPPAILVSDEVGLGIVPVTASGRQFRDALGWLNQQVAAAARQAFLLVAGIAVPLKPVP